MFAIHKAGPDQAEQYLPQPHGASSVSAGRIHVHVHRDQPSAQAKMTNRATKTPHGADQDARKSPVISNADMEPSQLRRAVAVARRSLASFASERDVAARIKAEFDAAFDPTWHCIVGRHFGSYVTHETERFIHFYLGDTAILLFKFG